jgi:hypothetical protein
MDVTGGAIVTCTSLVESHDKFESTNVAQGVRIRSNTKSMLPEN